MWPTSMRPVSRDTRRFRETAEPGSCGGWRLATVDEVANNVVWLAFRASSYMTGKIIELDGGAETLLDCRRNDRRCALLV
jgi:NAD(P)-dependent dehydrogenase (short-subunit alcohol dehydrogenase family)